MFSARFLFFLPDNLSGTGCDVGFALLTCLPVKRLSGALQKHGLFHLLCRRPKFVSVSAVKLLPPSESAGVSYNHNCSAGKRECRHSRGKDVVFPQFLTHSDPDGKLKRAGFLVTVVLSNEIKMTVMSLVCLFWFPLFIVFLFHWCCLFGTTEYKLCTKTSHCLYWGHYSIF